LSRIAVLTPYADPIPGGISTVVLGLRNLLRAHGHETYVLAGAGEGDSPEHSNLGTGLRYVRGALSALRGLSVDVIHCHAHWYTLLAGIWYRRARPSTRLVFSFHTSDVSHWGPIFSWLLSKADVLTFVSASQLSQLRSILRLGGDLRILYPGVIPRVANEAARREWLARCGLSDSFPVIGFVGPLDYPSKVRGVIDLVGIVKQLRTTYPTAKLVVVGDGKLSRRILEAALGAEDAVVVTGFVQDPSPAFASSDIYCHLSYRESFGIAVLEAMSMGSCVVALSSSGVTEIVDDAGVIIVDSDSRHVADAIRRLAADPVARRELGLKARDTALRLHTWEARWPQLASIYGLE